MTSSARMWSASFSADDATRVEVDDGGEIKPFIGGGNVGDVACQDLVRLLRERLAQ